MKYGGKVMILVNNKTKGIQKIFIQNKAFIILSSFLLFGIFIGAISSENFSSTTFDKINNIFLSNICVRESSSIIHIFVLSLSSSFLFILVAFFMGLSMWGCILVPLVPLIRGFCLGISQSYIFSTYGLKGLAFQILILLPGVFISSVSILLMSREAMRLSHNFSNFMLFGRREPFGKLSDIKMYLLRTGCVLTISVFSSVVDIILNMLFLRFFHF